jgi:glutathione S-transferase
MVSDNDGVIAGAMVIAEYIEETESPALLWGDVAARAEIRRLMNWFEIKFANEVGTPLLSERVIKRFSGEGQPSSAVIRAALSNLNIICNI